MRWDRGPQVTSSSPPACSAQAPPQSREMPSLGSSRPFLAPLWQILFLAITWASVKSGSNNDTKGWCLHRKQSSPHSHCEGSFSLHRAMRTEAVWLIFASFMFHITQEFYSTYLYSPGTDFMWGTSTSISSSSTKHLKAASIISLCHEDMLEIYMSSLTPLHSLRLLLKHSSLSAFDFAHAWGGPACHLVWG